ncbi:MAG: 4-hydroxy-tetrahydrodipicolinate reductase [Vicingaceae bacterium]
MKLALIGYGKMGKVIERIALQRGHEVILKITSENTDKLHDGSLAKADAAIEFSLPDFAVSNIKACFSAEVPVAVGTTGWYHQWEEVKAACEEKEGSLLAATNFSVGVNLFFELNRQLASLIETRTEYRAKIEEIHHTEKLDSPSGTAISLAEDLIKHHTAYNDWKNEKTKDDHCLDVLSYREAEVKGTHTITYDSEIDSISISHQAKSRDGFGLGAVLAAEYIADKKGLFTMKDLLKF